MDKLLADSLKVRRAFTPFCPIVYSLARWSETGQVLEIGVQRAQSTNAIIAGLKDRGSGLLTSVDMKDRSEYVAEEDKEFWNLVIGDSHDPRTVDKVRWTKYDFILIDGDHTTAGIRADFMAYREFLRPGGNIVFHDVLNNFPEGGVEKFWREECNESLGVAEKAVLPPWPGLGIVRFTTDNLWKRK